MEKTELEKDPFLKGVMNELEVPGIVPVFDHLLCKKVEMSLTKTKSGLVIPSAVSLSGERTGKDGATKKMFRLFVTAISKNVTANLGVDLQPGDEVYISDYEMLESNAIPFITDHEAKIRDIKKGTHYVIHYTELKAFKRHDVLREHMEKLASKE